MDSVIWKRERIPSKEGLLLNDSSSKYYRARVGILHDVTYSVDPCRPRVPRITPQRLARVASSIA